MLARLFFFVGLSLFALSCGDDTCELTLIIPELNDRQIYDQNVADIKSYLANNNLTALETSSGLHVIIDEAGSDVKPNLCDEVDATYKGYLLDGTEFDSGTAAFSLTGVIKGWQEGIPYFGNGGSGILLIPSYIGYGPNPRGSIISPNDVLIFDVTINGF